MRRIYIFLGVGAAIVIVAYIVQWLFGFQSYASWLASIGFHVLGGAYAFFFIRAIFLYKRPAEAVFPPALSVLIFMSGAVFLGVVWEWYEFLVDWYRISALGKESLMTYPDTIGDLFLDFFGAVIASFFIWKNYVSEK